MSEVALLDGILKVAAAGAPVQLTVHVGDAAGQSVEVVKNGEVVATLTVDAADQALTHTLTLTPGQWVHVRLRDARGVTALTNPVYVRGRASGT